MGAQSASGQAGAQVEARRIEEAALNATAVREQLFYDGWLLRFARESARRMRSINLIGPTSPETGLDTRLARCERLYGQLALPVIFRVTTLGEGPALDRQLEARAYARDSETLVMGRPLDMPPSVDAEPPPGALCKPIDPATFCDVLGELKGSSDSDVQAHARRLRTLAVDVLPYCVERAGAPIAAGLIVLEDEFAGVFDVAVATDHRRKGWGGLLVCRLMAEAARRGARWAYLQVEADNHAACRLYRSLGFHDIYTYWYRCPPQSGLPQPATQTRTNASKD